MKLDTANQSDQDVCPLCGKEPSTSREQIIPQEEMLRHDLNSRIEELDESIQRHTESLKKQKLIVSELQEKKALLDEQLKEELKNYDSTFLASSREVERRCATLQERLRGLERILRIPNAIARLEEKADKLASEEAHLEREIQEEKAELTSAGQYIQEIEDSFLQSLIEVGVPGVGPDDHVELNRKTWIPSVLPEGDKALKWDFYNAGSGGKKTLFNVCYLLAVHKVSDEQDLPLPTFLIIDTPMKNISGDVNREIFVAFYNYLYDLAVDSLSNTQFIIIDKECVSPDNRDIIFKERYMSNDDPEHPPLIPYY